MATIQFGFAFIKLEVVLYHLLLESKDYFIGNFDVIAV